MKKAFTIAELLIVLTIVGVVAVLTLPNVFDKTGNKTNVGLLQTVYSQVSDGAVQFLAEQNVREWDDVESDSLTFLKNYLNVTDACSTLNECFAISYKNLSAQSYEQSAVLNGYETFVMLNNGVSLAFLSPESGTLGRVLVDVNGPEKPNILGRDLFVFSIKSNGDVGVFDYNADEDTAYSDCSAFKNNGLPCIYYLSVKNWNMDY